MLLRFQKMSYYLYLVNSNWWMLPAELIKLLFGVTGFMAHLYALPAWDTSLHRGYMQHVQ